MNRAPFARPISSVASLSVWLLFMFAVLAQSETPTLNWKQLSNIPDRVGFRAPFAGVSGDALLVAGGANFPARCRGREDRRFGTIRSSS